MNNIIIKKCEIQNVLKLRHIVMYPEKDIKYVEVPGDYESSTIHLGLYDKYVEGGEKLISVISLFINNSNDDMQFRKFATLQQFQNQGYGSALLKYVLNYAKSIQIKRIWCNSRKEKISFYISKFNFKQTTQNYIKDGREFTIIELLL